MNQARCIPILLLMIYLGQTSASVILPNRNDDVPLAQGPLQSVIDWSYPVPDPEQVPECVEGASWMEDCNSCFCSNGHAACTLKLCQPEQVPECVDGESWAEDCNTCYCFNGHAGCTLMLCEPEPVPVCEEGSSWMEDCNSCYCSNGRAVCTLKLCLSEPECVEGSSWMEDCNTCFCSNGRAGCTEMFCPPKPEVQRVGTVNVELKVIPRELDGCYREMDGKLVRDTYVDSCQKCDYCEDRCEVFNHKTCRCHRKLRCGNYIEILSVNTERKKN